MVNMASRKNGKTLNPVGARNSKSIKTANLVGRWGMVNPVGGYGKDDSGAKMVSGKAGGGVGLAKW